MGYENDGYLVLRNVVPVSLLDDLDANIVQIVKKWTDQDVDSTRTIEFANLLLSDRELERRLYDSVRNFDWLQNFAQGSYLFSILNTLIGNDIGLFSKIPMRFDLPNISRELAVWHQDYFYVRGNTDVVTAWTPLQDTSYNLGCLMVMPGSHKLGPVIHDGEALGKRHFPTSIFEREVRYVEMKRGDLLLFNALLLHSSGMNISKTARVSIQARYTRLDASVDPSMGAVIPLSEQGPSV